MANKANLTAMKQKKLQLESHEKLIRDCLELIRLQKNKLQIEHLQLKSMIYEFNIKNKASDDSNTPIAKREVRPSASTSTEMSSGTKTFRHENYATSGPSSKSRNKIQRKSSGSNKQANKYSAANTQDYEATFLESVFDSGANTNINSQKLELDVSSALKSMLSGSFCVDHEEDDVEGLEDDCDDDSYYDEDDSSVSTSETLSHKRRKLDEAVRLILCRNDNSSADTEDSSVNFRNDDCTDLWSHADGFYEKNGNVENEHLCDSDIFDFMNL